MRHMWKNTVSPCLPAQVFPATVFAQKTTGAVVQLPFEPWPDNVPDGPPFAGSMVPIPAANPLYPLRRRCAAVDLHCHAQDNLVVGMGTLEDDAKPFAAGNCPDTHFHARRCHGFGIKGTGTSVDPWIEAFDG